MRRRRRHCRAYPVIAPPPPPPLLLLLVVVVVVSIVAGDGTADDDVVPMEWEDGPSSWTEFGHDNDIDVCGLRVLTLDEWEGGKHWTGNVPVLVSGVTDGWGALRNWKKREMVRLYPDAEATMGEGRLVGETGPDRAGSNLAPTTLKEFVTKHMYDPKKYFFDRKIAIPRKMLDDCRPFPMPTRAYLEGVESGSILRSSSGTMRGAGGGSSRLDNEGWRDHLAISIGSDLQGLTFHHHREAWNVVIFGMKRWILWDHARWKNNDTLQFRTTRDWTNDGMHVSGAEWIRRLYPEPERSYEIRHHGHDCVQHAGQMMFVPRGWMHMVVNIGDTVSVVSEVGLGMGEGRKPEDFTYDPFEGDDDARLRVARIAFCCSLCAMVASLARYAAISLRYHRTMCPMNSKSHSKIR